MKNTINMLVGVLVFAGVACGYTIPIGTPTIDGVVSTGEWDAVTWIDMDQIYYGDPADLSNAKWAAMWSPVTNKIYVAITGDDTTHTFIPEVDQWNSSDGVEVYIDPGNRDNDGYPGPPFGHTGDWVDAQQWAGAPDGTADGEWVTLGYQDYPLPSDLGFEASVSGDTITYELTLTPYDHYEYTDPDSSTILTLAADDVIGLDVVMNTRHGSDAGDFGMLCENLDVNKFSTASHFLDHTLEGGPQAPGDANGDGKVTIADFLALQNNFNQAGGWAEGDFNDDGQVTIADFLILQNNWGYGTAGAGSVPTIPEPTTIGLLLLGGLAILRRRYWKV